MVWILVIEYNMAETEMKTVTTLLDLIQQSLNTTGKACWRCPTW